MLVVEAVRNILGVSFVTDYAEFADFNLRKIQETSCRSAVANITATIGGNTYNNSVDPNLLSDNIPDDASMCDVNDVLNEKESNINRNNEDCNSLSESSGSDSC